MVQAQISLEWLLEGFKYDLESTTRPKTVKYYCGEISHFLRWADATGVPSDIRLLTKHHIQAFFYYLATTHIGNGSAREPAAVERLRWPYYRALRQFFGWAVKEGYLQNNPMDNIVVKRPQPAPIEPYRPEHINRILKVLDYDWQTSKTQRQKMLAVWNRAIFLLFLESGIRLEELAGLQLEDIDLQRQRVTIRLGKMGKSRLGRPPPQTPSPLPLNSKVP